ncbi:MAG: terminase [Magnetococcales bacterium]|nr:terminase [Magnetococcales bacterium]
MTEQEMLDLSALLTEFSGDPLLFVREAFPWGQGELEPYSGPEDWQREVLCDIRDGVLDLDGAIRIAVASGHGIGKSALVSWLILWGIITYPDAKGVVTANTEAQLKTKTWSELQKWFRLCDQAITRYFKITATALFSTDPKREKTWRIDMIPWSIANTEAFAGLHNQGKRILIFFDEASGIPKPIWEVTEGALTDRDTQILWIAFGNPTQNTGRFREAFGRLKHRWITRQVDSRSVSISDKTQIGHWIDDYGLQSDFVKVRVLGQFPSASSCQFISGDTVERASRRQASFGLSDPLIYGVDPARFGDDQSVIYRRRGRDGRHYPMMKYRGIDTMELAARVAELARKDLPDAIFVDGGGVGGGVCDRLQQLLVPDVVEVNFGARGDSDHANMRAVMWGGMRAWLEHNGTLPDDQELIDDLISVEYGFTADNKIQLEKKEAMKKRGLSSPDCGDALALTFAFPVGPRPKLKETSPGRYHLHHHNHHQAQVDYEPF